MSTSYGLTCEPPTCSISAFGGTSSHRLMNRTDCRLAFKVRSSNNSNYTVSVVSGFVNVNESIPFVITRIKGPPKADFLRLLWVDVKKEDTDPKKPFGPNGAIYGEFSGETIIKLSAAE